MKTVLINLLIAEKKSAVAFSHFKICKIWLFSQKLLDIKKSQLFADITMKNHKIKTSFVRPEGPKARANKTDIIL